MKRMTDKTKNIIYWIMFGCATLILTSAFVIGLIGLIKKMDLLVHLSLYLMPCSLLLNVINDFAFKVK